MPPASFFAPHYQGMPPVLRDAASVRHRRSKLLKRQSRVQPEEREVRKQASEPAPPALAPAPTPALRKHESYPQYTGTQVLCLLPDASVRQRRSKRFKRQSRVLPEEKEVSKQASELAAPAPAPTPALRKHESYPQYTGTQVLCMLPDASVRQRHSKLFKRQSRVLPEEREVRKQASEPAPPAPAPAPALRKHESYPQYTGTQVLCLLPDASVRRRHSKLFKRQSRVLPEEREVRKQASEPAPPAPAPAPALRKHESYPQYTGTQVLCLLPDASVRQRRSKLFKRQSRVQPEEKEVRKQASEPVPPAPTLRKHESYPQYTGTQNRTRTLDHEIGSLLIRAVTYIDRQTNPNSSASFEEAPQTRASHTPAVRNGPPLSCNFCWNTVDECGRILRRKTQYHCPECQTNLCIVPCFHEYHEGPDTAETSAASAR